MPIFKHFEYIIQLKEKEDKIFEKKLTKNEIKPYKKYNKIYIYNIKFKNKDGHSSHFPLKTSYEVYLLSIDEQFLLNKTVVREVYKSDQISIDNEEFNMPIISAYSSGVILEFRKLAFSFYLYSFRML